jgi:acyl-CoA reductase-like NAD-dependent aldehyde dehydrogenase
LELGGKNSIIIFDDCNYKKALETVKRSTFLNQGEICLCTSRVFIQEGIYEKFLKDFTEEVKKMVIGDPSDSKTQMGSLISVQHRKKIESYVKLALFEGGEVLYY